MNRRPAFKRPLYWFSLIWFTMIIVDVLDHNLLVKFCGERVYMASLIFEVVVYGFLCALDEHLSGTLSKGKVKE